MIFKTFDRLCCDWCATSNGFSQFLIDKLFDYCKNAENFDLEVLSSALQIVLDRWCLVFLPSMRSLPSGALMMAEEKFEGMFRNSKLRTTTNT